MYLAKNLSIAASRVPQRACFYTDVTFSDLKLEDNPSVGGILHT
jgi:hypothetical protein